MGRRQGGRAVGAELALPAWLSVALGGGLGAIVGSFAGTIVSRWPQGRSVVAGRSACDGCGQGLRARDLVPVLGYALSRGKCHACGAPIDPLYPAIEIACAALGGLAFAALPVPHALLLCLFFWVLVALASIDTRHFWLPDALVLPLAAAGLLAPLLIDAPPDFAARLLGLFAGFGSLALIALGYRAARGRDGLGGGDAKLLGAVGAWSGWQSLPLILLIAASAALVVVVLRLARGGTVKMDDRLPFGAFLAGAAIAWQLAAVAQSAQ